MFSTFSGGIYPRGKKKITENINFSNLPIPQFCYIPIHQHIGKPAKPLVEVRDVVREGQLIAAANGELSSNIHSSIPGRVLEIKQSPNIYADQTVIVIEAGGSFGTSYSKTETSPWENLTKEEIIIKIENAGIVGLGGAAFPTNIKLNPPADKKIDLLIVNGIESDPYFTCDDVLMKTFPAEIIEGIKIAMKTLGACKTIIGIDKNHSTTIKSLQENIDKLNLNSSMQIKVLKSKYPQGAEKQLIFSLTGKKVPSGRLPLDIGAVVINAGTLFAVRDAVLSGKPLFERYITVSGKMILKPGNYKVRIGTRISDIIEECGGLTGAPERIVMGGSLCGQIANSLDTPVVKGTAGILFMSKDEVNSEKPSACIRCGKCVDVCPSGLLPCDIAKAYEKNKFDIAALLNPLDCIQCGSCSYICPSRKPLSLFIRLARQELKKQ
jgi:electron transport complex protein RnfC